MNDLFKGRTDGRVLIVASLGPCRAVQLEEDFGLGLGNVDPRVLGVTSGQVAVRRKIQEGQWAVLQFGSEIVLTIQMPVGRKDIVHVKALAIRIALSLLHPLQGVL